MKPLYSKIKRKLIFMNRFFISTENPYLTAHSLKDKLVLNGPDCIGQFEKACSDIFSDFNNKTRVLIKVNLNSGNPYPASVSVSFLKTVIKALKEQGVTCICVSDCSGITHLPTSEVIRNKKLKVHLKPENVRVVSFDYGRWNRIFIKGEFFEDILIAARIRKYDKLINLSNLKAHQYTGFSAATKNLVGLMHPLQRKALHRDHIIERTAELSLAVEPDINIIDARKIFINGGPDTGLTVDADTIIISNSLLEADSAAYELLIEKKRENGIYDLPDKYSENPFFKHFMKLKGTNQ